MSESFRDVTVVGGGPSGLACARACAKAGLHVTLIECLGFGGQLMSVPIEGEPQDQSPVWGPDYAGALAVDAMHSGADCQCTDIIAIEHRPDLDHPWCISLPTESLNSKFLVAATGATPRALNIEGSDAFRDRGICYCATCDGPLYAGKTVAIIVDDRWAMMEAVCLADVVGRLLVVGTGWERPEWLQWRENLFSRSNVTVLNGNVVALRGESTLGTIVVELVMGREELAVDAVFVALGTVPVSEMFSRFVKLDSSDSIVVDRDLQTHSAGLFAVGDVRSGSARSAAGAVGDGEAVAARIVTTLATG